MIVELRGILNNANVTNSKRYNTHPTFLMDVMSLLVVTFSVIRVQGTVPYCARSTDWWKVKTCPTKQHC